VSPWAALHPLRIGCVQYLNARPLIQGYDGEVVFDHPSALARELAAGRLDAALVPVFEILREPVYDLVDEVAIASDGPVFSVVLAYRGELKDLRAVSFDPASLTSVHLLKVLLGEFHGLQLESRKDAEAMLLIGNQAIEFRAQESARYSSLRWLDLGEEWQRCTHLPFVYAVWALRPGLANGGGVAAAFRALKSSGVDRVADIVNADQFQDAAFRQRYLTQHIRFDLGVREKLGLNRFRALLAKWRLIASDASPLRFG
jgi:chorismate dehydratase